MATSELTLVSQNHKSNVPVAAGPEPVSRGAVLQWLDEAHAASKGTPWGEQLVIDVVDVLEVLLEPLHLAMLGALRAGGDPHATSDARGLTHRARWIGYRLKKLYHERRARLSTARPAPATTLFWPRELTHINAQLPVLRSLERRGASCAVLACLPRTFDQLRSRGVEAVFAGGAWPEVVREARRLAARRAQSAAAAPALNLPPFFAAGRASALESIWRAAVCRQLPEVCEAVANARAAIERFNPAVIVIGNDITLHGRAAALVAQTMGVQTAVLMHGNVTGDELHGRHLADAVVVYGEASRREVIRHGVDAARVLACGAPYLDQRATQSGQMDSRIRTRVGMGEHDRWILVATSGPGDRISHQHHQLVVENLQRLAASLPGTHLIVKLHRKDRVAHYQQALQAGTGGRIHVLPFGEPGLPTSIFDWLQGCRLLLTGASTVAVEAALMDVPVITMDFCGEIQNVDFIDAGATQHVTNAAELLAAIERVFASDASLSAVRQRAERYLADAFLSLDGRSADRTADAILSLGRRTATAPAVKT